MNETLYYVIDIDIAAGTQNQRVATDQELADREAMAQAELEREAEAQAKTNARLSALAKLADLGLTQDEINAL